MHTVTEQYRRGDASDSCGAFGAKSGILALCPGGHTLERSGIPDSLLMSQKSHNRHNYKPVHPSTRRLHAESRVASNDTSGRRVMERGSGDAVAPRVPPASPDNVSRAREPRMARYRPTRRASQAAGPSLPSAGESLPTPLGPVGTAFPWSQGRIPTAGYFPAPHRHQRYRTTKPQPNHVIGQGVPKKNRTHYRTGTHPPGCRHPVSTVRFVSRYKP